MRELHPEIQPEIVIHLAAETGTAQSLSEATRHARVNVVGNTQMLDGFSRELGTRVDREPDGTLTLRPLR